MAIEENCGPPSVALEHGFLFRDEGLVGAAEILGLHADRLGLRLGLDRLFDAHVPFLASMVLVIMLAKVGTVGDTPGQLARLVLELSDAGTSRL
jgi:hypothetical protein